MLASTNPFVLFIRVECRRHWCYHMNPLTFGFARTALRLFSPQDRDLEFCWKQSAYVFQKSAKQSDKYHVASFVSTILTALCLL